MSGKMIVIKPDDTIELADYNGYESLSEAVGGGGMIEYFHSTDLPVLPSLAHGKETLPVDFICNEEFLIDDSEEFNKINAVASLLSGKEIRGNVIMLVNNGNGENRGFEYLEEETVEGAEPEEALCECWTAEDTVLKYINTTRAELQKLHQQYDNNKSDPVAEIRTWD